MKNEEDVKEWVYFADMDLISAKHLFETLYPRPLEVVCFHCQQAAEKMLKALMVAYDIEPLKTHQLRLLADKLKDMVNFSVDILNACADLTQYGVKLRYPYDANIDEHHTKKALTDMQLIYEFVKVEFEKLN